MEGGLLQRGMGWLKKWKSTTTQIFWSVWGGYAKSSRTAMSENNKKWNESRHLWFFFLSKNIVLLGYHAQYYGACIHCGGMQAPLQIDWLKIENLGIFGWPWIGFMRIGRGKICTQYPKPKVVFEKVTNTCRDICTHKGKVGLSRSFHCHSSPLILFSTCMV